MRKSTALLASALALMLALAALFVIGGTLSARLSAASAGATEHPQAFRAIRRMLAAGAAPQRFDEAALDKDGDYRLEDVTVTLINRGLIDAEWLYVQVEGAPGDIAVYSISGEGGTVPARGTAALNVKLISHKDGGGPRVYHIQYYVYGMKRSIDVRQG